MNNGKVRIYELARELDLDNKKILGICEQLNIAVKSHSSTITETEAEHIRQAAENANSLVATKERGTSTPERRNGAPTVNKVAARPVVQPKPQVLEIRQYNSRPGSPPAKALTSPQPPVKPSVASSATKPTPPSRPVVRGTTTETNLEAEQELETVPTLGEIPETEMAALEEVAPELVEPPARTAEPHKSLVPPSQVERPVLKKAKSDQASEARTQTSPRPATAKPQPNGEARSGRAGEGRREDSAASELGEKRRGAGGLELVPPRLPKLVKPPTRPGQKTEIAAVGGVKESLLDGDGDTLLAPELADLQLKRPPARPVKKKEWEDEEEETDASKAKAAGKVKRRPIVIDDDDDDLEAGLGDSESPMALSLSIARPPKPKAIAGAVVVAAPTASRTRKPGQKGSGANRHEQRANRRDKKAVVERPDHIVLSGSMTVREMATALGVTETEIIKKLFFKGMAVNITQTLDNETVKMVAEEMGVAVEDAEEQAAATKVTEMVDETDLENQHRPPVVTIMGHVDHGKTTLLDAIRSTKVAQGEAGGITQHIGAYHVDVEHEGEKKQVVFLDTPGHEAFTAMRARGARVTDIAILVVAADDGVQPQTIEAISHARAAEVPIVVAINKIDKVGAQPDRVKQELTDRGLQPEEWGGDTIMVPVSAIKGENLDRLLEMILLVAEIGELTANPDRPAKGTVIEANLDKARGPVATLLVQNGTLRVGDTLVAGSVFGKVRAMVDDRGARVTAATPSFAVEVLGLSDVPAAGDEFEVYPSEKEARAIANTRTDEQRQSRLQQVMASRRVTLNSLSAQAKEGELKELNLILKADVQGSVEAILNALKQLPQNEVQVRVLFAAPGEITETDVDLAAASGAVIVGFNTTLATGSRSAADQAEVDVREYNIIYKLLDDIQGAMEGLLEPEQVEEPLGQVEVRAVFTVGRGAVAGCYVLSGKAVRNCKVRVRRNSKVIFEGMLDSLKRMKEDTREVNAGYECGIGIDKFNDWAEGDIIETYQMVSKRRTLSPV